MTVVYETNLPLKPHGKGKVRDIYDLGEQLLIVVTDRISAFDVILPNGIPKKGEVLNKLSAYWFNETQDIVKNHMITIDASEYPDELQEHKNTLEGRSMLVKKAKPLPIECVIRGYLSGSGWKEYKKEGGVCGINLPKGLIESGQLPEPIFTPATKADSGHDINITYEQAEKLVGSQTAAKIRDYATRIYTKASEAVESKGIIIADTKFEFGLINDEIILIDEVLTPDSSRFWPKDTYKPGGPQISYDKQYVRDYLESIKWNKEPPAPKLPEDVAAETSKKYVEAYHIISGRQL